MKHKVNIKHIQNVYNILTEFWNKRDASASCYVADALLMLNKTVDASIVYVVFDVIFSVVRVNESFDTCCDILRLLKIDVEES